MLKDWKLSGSSGRIRTYNPRTKTGDNGSLFQITLIFLGQNFIEFFYSYSWDGRKGNTGQFM